MTTQAAEELDIFKTGAQSGKPVEAPKAEEQQSKKTSPANAIQGDRKKRIVNFVNRIEAWHFLVLAAVLAVLFVMVPKLFPKHQTSAQQQPTPVQQDAVNNVLTAPEPEPQEAVVPAASPEQSALSAEQLKGLNEQVGSLSGVVVGLQKTISELEAKVALLESDKADAGKKVVHSPAVRRQAQVSQPSAMAGYTLNTVYSDQAWIQHGEKTFVVQVGDLVDGVKITGIDPVARRVTTSRGVIR